MYDFTHCTHLEAMVTLHTLVRRCKFSSTWQHGTYIHKYHLREDSSFLSFVFCFTSLMLHSNMKLHILVYQGGSSGSGTKMKQCSNGVVLFARTRPSHILYFIFLISHAHNRPMGIHYVLIFLSGNRPYVHGNTCYGYNPQY